MQVLRELTAHTQVYPAAKAFFNDANSLADVAALGLDVFGGQGAAGLCDRLERAVVKHRDQAVGLGADDGGFNADLFVDAAHRLGRVQRGGGLGGGGVHLELLSRDVCCVDVVIGCRVKHLTRSNAAIRHYSTTFRMNSWPRPPVVETHTHPGH